MPRLDPALIFRLALQDQRLIRSGLTAEKRAVIFVGCAVVGVPASGVFVVDLACVEVANVHLCLRCYAAKCSHYGDECKRYFSPSRGANQRPDFPQDPIISDIKKPPCL